VKNLTTLTTTAKVSELGALDASVELTASGDSDWRLRSAFRSLPRANWQRADFFAQALRDDVDSAQAAHDAEKTLSDIGDQFESGEYDHLDVNSYSAMDMVALSWARMGWAWFLQGDNLVASQYLESAWDLSQSGTIANRLARVYEKTGARDRAQHMYALSVAAGGPDAQNSRDHVMKINSATASRKVSRT
jgi:hypothetical protein